MTNRELILESYGRIGNIKGVCAETGCSPYSVYIVLQKEKLLKERDRRNYGTATGLRGRDAEDEFQRLVPQAVNANKTIDQNMPSFDFMIGEITVDVKCYRPSSQNNKWALRFAHNKAFGPDFYSMFLLNDRDSEVTDGYRILLIPHALTVGASAAYIDPKVPEMYSWWDFLIAPNELAQVLSEAASSEIQKTPPAHIEEDDELRIVNKIGRAIVREANKLEKIA
ncbi:MAG: hypothetical protein FWD62_05490 [Betaproteobacteria bacterium]|nr:hypothetical protein [Betaproteobacteria bacterium]